MHDAEISRKLAWPFNSGPDGGLKIRGGGYNNLVGIICSPYWNRVHQPKIGPLHSFPPALQYPAPEESSIIFCVLFLNFHILRALSFDRQSLTQVYFFYCYLSFQKFVKALLMLRTINSNILLTGSNNLFRNANSNFHEFSEQSKLVIQTEIRKNSGVVVSELIFGSGEQEIWLYSYNKIKKSISSSFVKIW